jgi:hypothetical protein
MAGDVASWLVAARILAWTWVEWERARTQVQRERRHRAAAARALTSVANRRMQLEGVDGSVASARSLLPDGTERERLGPLFTLVLSRHTKRLTKRRQERVMSRHDDDE